MPKQDKNTSPSARADRNDRTSWYACRAGLRLPGEPAEEAPQAISDHDTKAAPKAAPKAASKAAPARQPRRDGPSR